MNYFKIYIRQARKLSNGSYPLISLLRNYPKWKSSLQPGRNTLDDNTPWMTFDAIYFLRKHLNKNMNVFEYGSGGSSIFFCKSANSVVTVEHDMDWYRLVKKKITECNISNWTGIHVSPEKSSSVNADASDPHQYSTIDPSTRNFSFEKYVKAIDDFPENHFDVVVIDGRSRPSCIMHSVSKVKGGGYLVLDNADRDYYQPAEKKFLGNGFELVVGTFGPTSHNPEFTMTKIWKKK